MYKHIVLWKLKAEADGLNKDQLAIEVKQRLDALPSVISEIKEYEVAINIGSYGASFYDVILISIFENKDTFWAYTKYPEHDEVVDFIQSVQEDEQIVDYEL
ncbi:Dabb family protein [Carboxylicivirga marina]|uniref:Dabb family protein n=1 Tax=Carboxylicivirga marina TaxID=2800988 RepID=UPI0025990360|nr:Dabb family protein [uncultured Carboxylicivirga sp.]